MPGFSFPFCRCCISAIEDDHNVVIGQALSCESEMPQDEYNVLDLIWWLSFTGVVCEKASIDESYLDVTDAAMARLQKQEHPWSNPSMLPEGVDQIHVGCLVRVLAHYPSVQ